MRTALYYRGFWHVVSLKGGMFSEDSFGTLVPVLCWPFGYSKTDYDV